MKRAPDHLRARVCQQCGAAFATKPSKKAKFCGRTCQAEAIRTLPPLLPRDCQRCGTTFTPSKGYHQARFCSKRCIWEVTKGPEFNARISRENAQERGNRQRDRGAGKTYRKRDGRHEHRIVAEQMLGHPLRRGEIVHHIDGDKRNNAPENLRVMTQREHMQEHGLGIPGMVLHWKPWEHRR